MKYSIQHFQLTGTILLISFLIASCTGETRPGNDTAGADADSSHAFAKPIESAHNKLEWMNKDALKTAFTLNFGGQERLDATLYIQTGTSKVRLEMGEDTVAVFDGSNMWVTPSDSAITPFDLKTWAYFMEVPFKLNDPGTMISESDTAMMHGDMYDTARLTFEPGTGDSPEDWYILYRDRESGRLHAMAYIVTYKTPVEEANKNPHAISYEQFRQVGGVPIPTRWKFWEWSQTDGFSDNPIGEATLKNTQFVSSNGLFRKPEGSTPMKR